MRAGVSLHAFNGHLQLSTGDDRRRGPTLLSSGNQMLIDRAVPHLITRDPNEFWTAGQWMTELTGGSDVGLSETIAKLDEPIETFVSTGASGSPPLFVLKWRLRSRVRKEIRRVDAVSRSSTSKRETSTAVRATFRSIG